MFAAPCFGSPSLHRLINYLSLLSSPELQGIFVIFALGADDVFVAVDKWKNARLENPNGPTTAIAAKAMPDAAGAMLLTTTTTAIAFFGTAICPVAPILCFAVFCGLLVVFDYILCVLLVFPALCIYDARRESRNCCCRCIWCFGERNSESQESDDTDDLDATPSLIRRILMAFYDYVLHPARWVLLLACIAALVVSAVYAASIEMPTSADVRLYLIRGAVQLFGFISIESVKAHTPFGK